MDLELLLRKYLGWGHARTTVRTHLSLSGFFSAPPPPPLPSSPAPPAGQDGTLDEGAADGEAEIGQFEGRRE